MSNREFRGNYIVLQIYITKHFLDKTSIFSNKLSQETKIIVIKEPSAGTFRSHKCSLNCYSKNNFFKE